jgi:hypothetical protein
MMASTPHDFVLHDEFSLASRFSSVGINDENSDLLRDVLMKVCEEQDLSLALKIGAHRGINEQLKQAGDGIVAFADASVYVVYVVAIPRFDFLPLSFLVKTTGGVCFDVQIFESAYLVSVGVNQVLDLSVYFY